MTRLTLWTSVTVRRNENVLLNSKMVYNGHEFEQFQVKYRSTTRNSEKNSLSIEYDARVRVTSWTSVTMRDAVTVRRNEKNFVKVL